MLLFYTIPLEKEEDKTKMELIYNKYHKLMLGRAWQMLREQMAAEDAVHISFLKLMKHLDIVTDVYELRTKRLVLTILENTVIDMLRKRKREKHVSLEETEAWRMSAADREAFYDLPEENRIITAIKSMPQLYRDVFLLKYSSGYENGEISKMLGISEESVRKRISRGKKELEKLLNAEGIL